MTHAGRKSPPLIESAVSGALFGAVAAGRVEHRDSCDQLVTAEGPVLDVTDYMAALAAAGYVRRAGTGWRLTGDGEIKASEYAIAALTLSCQGRPASADTRPRRDIHTSFGLSYSNYLVMPRTLLQSMPAGWQERFVALVDEFNDAFSHVPQADAYEVTAGEEREVGCLTKEELEVLGITEIFEVDEFSELGVGEPDALGRYVYRDRNGEEMENWHRVVYPKPDPVPHYNRGRTRVEPWAGRCLVGSNS